MPQETKPKCPKRGPNDGQNKQTSWKTSKRKRGEKEKGNKPGLLNHKNKKNIKGNRRGPCKIEIIQTGKEKTPTQKKTRTLVENEVSADNVVEKRHHIDTWETPNTSPEKQ